MKTRNQPQPPKAKWTPQPYGNNPKAIYCYNRQEGEYKLCVTPNMFIGRFDEALPVWIISKGSERIAHGVGKDTRDAKNLAVKYWKKNLKGN
jgi:hypothetical protein